MLLPVVGSALTSPQGFLPHVVDEFSTPTPPPSPSTGATTIPPDPEGTPILEPPPRGNVTITYIFYVGNKGSQEPDEFVEIKNLDSSPLQLDGWTLRDAANHVFTFPNFRMDPGKVCRVYTNEIHSEWCGFSFGSGSAIWNNGGDCAYLRNSIGITVDDYCY